MRGGGTARRLVGLMLVGVMALGACGGADDDANAKSSSSEIVSQVADDVVGRYAHYDVVAYESTDMKTLIISYGFTDLSEKNGELIAKESFCSSEHRSDQPITTDLSDAATSAIRPRSTPVTVTEKNGRVRIQRPITPTGIGVRLRDPANDPLPTDPNDPRIADDDNDGKPGVTVTIKVTDSISGELYIARREIFAYDVVRQDDGSLTGTVDDDSEQLIVGASNDMFKTEAEWTQHPDPKKSPIILKPVDKTWDCTRLMAERDQLFPPTPEVDW